MSAVAETIPHAWHDDSLARRNAMVLAVAQAFGGANNTIIFSTASIVGSVIAPDKGLATLPVTCMVLGMWIGTLPVGWLARRLGRRYALQIGTLFGMASGLISCAAVISANFWLLLFGTFCGGLYAAAFQSYRFAAADTASESYRAKAVSWVLAGGVFAGVLGPQLVIFTTDLLTPYTFAATYLGQSVFALISLGVLQLVNIPKNIARYNDSGRPLFEIVRAPRFIIAVVCGVTAYAVMNLVMTAAPLAMVGCGHSVTDATLGIQWHVLAMYGPSFVTGSIIARYGVNRVTVIGLILLALTAVAGLSGTSVAHFWTALILLGLGWNLAFIGATTMVTGCHRPEERTKVQSFNDFLIFGAMAMSSFSSGQILAHFGWEMINSLVFPAVLLTAALLLWGVLRRRAEVSAV
ncbi:MAG: MFS transporter [Rhodopseudomonas sp.]|nr:MFS transporter [Rhodopseudomonas sp.]